MPVVNKQYLLVKRLGEGAQGKVKLVLNLQDMSLYAIKFISKKHLRSSIRWDLGGNRSMDSASGCI